MKYVIPVALFSIILIGGFLAFRNINTTTDDNTPYNKLTKALLEQRLQIDVVREEGGTNSCEPQEPYYRLTAKEHGFETYIDPETEFPKIRQILKDTDIANGLLMIESTGQVEVYGPCLE